MQATSGLSSASSRCPPPVNAIHIANCVPQQRFRCLLRRQSSVRFGNQSVPKHHNATNSNSSIAKTLCQEKMPETSDGREENTLQNIRDQVAAEDLLNAATAFYRWRESSIKATFRKQLHEILEDVAEDEARSKELQKGHEEVLKKNEELSLQLAALHAQHRTTTLQLEHANSGNAELFKALEGAEGSAREHQGNATSTSALLREQIRRHEEEQQRMQLQLEGLQDNYQATLGQARQLMEQLAEKDAKIASIGGEANKWNGEVKKLQADVVRLEGIVRATGERAASAEAQLQGRAETIAQLHSQLAELRERYHEELSELKAARVSCAEAKRLQDQLDSAQHVTAGMAAARGEMRSALDTLTARLASAEERAMRFAAASSMREAVLQVIQGMDTDADVSDALDALSAQLDETVEEAANLAGRLAANEAVMAQQENHIRRIGVEVSDQQRKQAETVQHNQHLQKMVVELQAEIQRLAAEAAMGPAVTLDASLQLAVVQPPQRPKATTPPVSKVETHTTALRVVIADKTFTAKALAKQLAIQGTSLPLVNLNSKQRALQAVLDALSSTLDSASKSLGKRPLDASGSLEELRQGIQQVTMATGELIQHRDGLSGNQVELVGTGDRLGQAEAALKSASALLSGWSALLGRVMLGGETVDDSMRGKLRKEIKVAEDRLHWASAQLAGSAMPGAVASGEVSFTEVDTAVREALNDLMELSSRLKDSSVLSDAKLKLLIASTQTSLHAKEHGIARLRGELVNVPTVLAAVTAKITTVLADVAVVLTSMQEVRDVLEEYLRAGKDAPVDVPALQGEVLMMRSLVREKDRAIAELEAAGSVRTTTIGTGSAQGAISLVPLEALQASERIRDAAEQERGRLQAAMMQLRLRHGATRLMFVDYFDNVRASALLSVCFAGWRGQAAKAQAAVAKQDADAARAEQSRLLDLTKRNRQLMAVVLSRFVEDHDMMFLHTVLMMWKAVARRQVAARQNWQALVGGVLAVEEAHEMVARDNSLVLRLIWRKRLVADEPLAVPMSALQIQGLVFGAWRSWVRLRAKNKQVDSLTASLPAWVSSVGDRRRLERAWLAWRLALLESIRDNTQELQDSLAAQLAAISQQPAGPDGEGPLGIPGRMTGDSQPGDVAPQGSRGRQTADSMHDGHSTKGRETAECLEPVPERPCRPGHRTADSVSAGGGQRAGASKARRTADSVGAGSRGEAAIARAGSHSAALSRRTTAGPAGGTAADHVEPKSRPTQTPSLSYSLAPSAPPSLPTLPPPQEPPGLYAPTHAVPQPHLRQRILAHAASGFTQYTTDHQDQGLQGLNLRMAAVPVHAAVPPAPSMPESALLPAQQWGFGSHFSHATNASAAAASSEAHGGLQGFKGFDDVVHQESSFAGSPPPSPRRLTQGSIGGIGYGYLPYAHAVLSAEQHLQPAIQASELTDLPPPPLLHQQLALQQQYQLQHQHQHQHQHQQYHASEASLPSHLPVPAPTAAPPLPHTFKSSSAVPREPLHPANTNKATGTKPTSGASSTKLTAASVTASGGAATGAQPKGTKAMAAGKTLVGGRAVQGGSSVVGTQAARQLGAGRGAAAGGTSVLSQTQELHQAITDLTQALHSTMGVVSPRTRMLQFQPAGQQQQQQSVAFSGATQEPRGMESQAWAGGPVVQGHVHVHDMHPADGAPEVFQATATSPRADSPRRTTAGDSIAVQFDKLQGWAGPGTSASQQEQWHSAGQQNSAAREVSPGRGPNQQQPWQQHDQLSASYKKALGLIGPISEAVPGVCATVPPTVPPPAAGPAPATAGTRTSTHASSKGKYSHIPSRLQHETISTLAKRRTSTLPGGTPNLTAIPSPPIQPTMSPLSTFLPPCNTTPGPISPRRLILHQPPPQPLQPASHRPQGPAQVINAFESIYGPDGTSGPPTLQPTIPSTSVRGNPGAGTAVGGGGDMGSGAGGRGTSPQRGAGSQGADRAASPKVIRFERRHLTGGHGGPGIMEGGAAGSGDGIPVTLVRLPEPVRFDISRMR